MELAPQHALPRLILEHRKLSTLQQRYLNTFQARPLYSAVLHVGFGGLGVLRQRCINTFQAGSNCGQQECCHPLPGPEVHACADLCARACWLLKDGAAGGRCVQL